MTSPDQPTTDPEAGSGAPAQLRSRVWFADPGKTGFIARSHLRAAGLTDEAFDGRPVVGIANSWSELNPCNGHLRDVAAAVRRGVLAAGGLPLEFPTMSLGEPLMRPTTMLYRNLMSIDVEETLRANPVDAVVLLGGCDKTTPAQLMGAASVDLPTLMVTGGPMVSGSFRGEPIGSGTDLWRFSEDVRSGQMSSTDFTEAESCIHRSAGHCMTMGTASTMACLTEALGIQMSGGAAFQAVDSGRRQLAERSGRRAVHMAGHGPRPSAVLTRQAFENAARANAAIGGSTNAVLHLLALAGRVGVDLTLDDLDRLGRDVPLLVDLKPSGTYLMAEFEQAGGMPALLHELLPLLHADAITVDGPTLGDAVRHAERYWPEVIRGLDEPVLPSDTGTAVLRGNLCPDGAVIKQSAAEPRLLKHRGRALVFDDVESYLRAAEDPALDVDADSVLIVRNCGPRGYPGMPEIGNLPIPVRLLESGVTDMVRISDARMSGTSYGTVILHAAPEAAAGGPLALVRNGDMVALDVSSRRLDVEIDDAELERRRAEWSQPPPSQDRGWAKLYVDHVLQADQGADLDFLVGSSGDAVPRVPF
ncbi:dihydroxy-acid dehydratase [Actinobacteria bacterium YIM 96077]|uniref:Dihydroxy-acid dehydratase n=1 Tax=Phytoactinopolyspora halophila TaxID=1981511 RepID=A0A329QYY1_9ACTN|nr:dihydroxy-acid dehydratase [Phytoactinopolyspora halophila]AYY13160.1 dihydroxy-acid dehydratase [Actinobacteria bacterium YIM 96077]RAW17600.1 dihydroxy-acid dehydratase [Phytoactinopolyspora halophila]